MEGWTAPLPTGYRQESAARPPPHAIQVAGGPGEPRGVLVPPAAAPPLRRLRNARRGIRLGGLRGALSRVVAGEVLLAATARGHPLAARFDPARVVASLGKTTTLPGSVVPGAVSLATSRGNAAALVLAGQGGFRHPSFFPQSVSRFNPRVMRSITTWR